jgi:hypothetical protein
VRQLRLTIPFINGPTVILEDGRISEVRLSLPIVGGCTAIYTRDELVSKYNKLRRWLRPPKPSTESRESVLRNAGHLGQREQYLRS